MKKIALAMWNEDQGFLTFEWILLVTLLTIGIVSGITAVRDATIDELGDIAQAMLSLDQSYTVAAGLRVTVHETGDASTGSSSAFGDKVFGFSHCGRTSYNGPTTDCNPTNCIANN